MEQKRQKSVLQQQKYKEKKGRKRELGKATPIAPSVEPNLGSPFKKPRKNQELDDNEGSGMRNCIEQSTFKLTEQMDSSLALNRRIKEEQDCPISIHQQSLIEDEVKLPQEEDQRNTLNMPKCL